MGLCRQDLFELIHSGHDGDDAKPYQEKAVRELLQKIAEARQRAGHE